MRVQKPYKRPRFKEYSKEQLRAGCNYCQGQERLSGRTRCRMEFDRRSGTREVKRRGRATSHFIWAAMLWCSWHSPHAANFRNLAGAAWHLCFLDYHTHISSDSSCSPWLNLSIGQCSDPQAISIDICPPAIPANSKAATCSASLLLETEGSQPLRVVQG